jgi:N-acetyl-beta-hexosaminidase
MQLDISNQLMSSKEILMLWLHENECFHWHLADDQGWRMIENHPKLTKLA